MILLVGRKGNSIMFKQIEDLLEHKDFDSTESAVEFATKISLYYLNLVKQSKYEYTEDVIVFSFSKISVGYQITVNRYNNGYIVCDEFPNHLIGEGRDYFEALSDFVETMQKEIRVKISQILGIKNT